MGTADVTRDGDFFNRLRDLVARDHTELALEQLALYLKGQRRVEELREVVVQQARLSRVAKRERQGLMTAQEVARDRAMLDHAVLQLVDDLETTTTADETPFPTPDVDLETPRDAELEKIFGVSHLKAVSWLARGLEVARSIGRVVTPRGLGSGFLVGGGHLLTNHHVVPSAEVAQSSHLDLNFQEDIGGQLEPFYRYRLCGDGLVADRELDFSLVPVREGPSLPPLETWGALALEAGAPPEVGEHVSIIQHPGGGPKQIAITANQVVSLFAHRLHYTTDTLPGSSGAPVFNDAWRVVALHRAGGNLVVNERGDRMFANEGTLVGSILKSLPAR